MSLASHLNTLESSGLIRLAQVEPELEYLFRHTLVQEAVYASLLKADQKRLHHIVGEALERAYPDRLGSRELAPVLGHHFAQAGDAGRALRYFALAADVAMASYANQEAEGHCRAALALAHTEEDRADLLVTLGRLLARQSRHREAIATWRQVIDLCVASGDRDRVAWLYARSARALWYLSEIPVSLALCDEGLAVVGDGEETPGLAALLHETARACYFNGVQDRALALCQRALDMARRLGAVDVQGDALTTLAILPGRSPEEVLGALGEAVALAESAGLLRLAIRAHHNLANARRAFELDSSGSRTHFLRAAELARQRGSVSEELMSRLSAAYLSLSEGELVAVAAEIAAMRQLLASLPDPGTAGAGIDAVEAGLLTQRGEWERARRLLLNAAAQARRLGNLDLLFGLDGALANVVSEMIAWGQPVDMRDAEDALLEAISIAERGVADKVQAHCKLAVLYLLVGRSEEARQRIAEAEFLFGPSSFWWEGLMLDLANARLAAAEGRWSDAVAGYEKITATFVQVGARWERARFMLDWATAQAARGEPGDRERARALVREALESFEHMGATGYVKLAEAHLEKLSAEIYDELLDRHKAAQELATAGQIQTAFLPEALPSPPGWQIAARWEPARQTSGDFYDAIPLPGGRLGLLIADVSDKGAGAALYMAMSRTVIRTYAAEHPTRPEAALAAGNRRILADSHANMFVTAFYGVLDPESGTLTYCNAGHNPPYLFHVPSSESGPFSFEPLPRTALPLGIPSDVAWEQATVQIAPGDVLLLYTDGVLDAQDPQGALFGRDRLLQTAQASLGGSALQIQDALFAAVHHFAAGALPADDITVMVVVREPPSSD